MVKVIHSPRAFLGDKFVDVCFDVERYTLAELRNNIRGNMRNIQQGGREAGAMVRGARGNLSRAQLAELAGRSVDEVRRLERHGTPEIAARELCEEVYGRLPPSPIHLLSQPFEAAGVAAAVRHGRARRSFAEVESIIWLDRGFLASLEQAQAWRMVEVARDVLKALAKHGAKLTAEHKSLAAWYWAHQRFN